MLVGATPYYLRGVFIRNQTHELITYSCEVSKKAMSRVIWGGRGFGYVYLINVTLLRWTDDIASSSHVVSSGQYIAYKIELEWGPRRYRPDRSERLVSDSERRNVSALSSRILNVSHKLEMKRSENIHPIINCSNVKKKSDYFAPTAVNTQRFYGELIQRLKIHLGHGRVCSR